MRNLRAIFRRPTAGSIAPADANPGGNLPLFPAACLFAVGIALTQWMQFTASFVLLAVVAMGMLCVLSGFRAQRVAWLPLGLLWLLLGNWCALLEPQPAPSPVLAPLANGLTRVVEGTVVDASPLRTVVDEQVPEDELSQEPAATAQPTQRMDIDLTSIEQVTDTDDRQTPTTGRARITVRWATGDKPAAFHCGDRIRGDLRLLRQPDYRNPGSWSRTSYLLDEGITATAAAPIRQIARTGESHPFSPACLLSNLQHGSATRLMMLPATMRHLPATLRISEDDAVMLAAMVTGDRTYLRHSLRVGFERTGSFHMLVVSGFHLAIVAACLNWLMRRLRLRRVPATFATIAATLVYALFTGFGIPVQRAFWMVTLYLLGRLIYRERSAMNAMGLAALCLLAASPRSLFDASLQMTLLAVVAIGGIAAPLLARTVHPYSRAADDIEQNALETGLEPRIAEFRIVLRMLAERLERVGNHWLGWRAMPWLVRLTVRIVELFVVSAVVELAMTLPMAIYFHRITLYALPANMLMLPLLFLLLPMALITLAVLAVWPAAAALPGAVTAIGLHLGIGLVHLLGSVRMSDLRMGEPLPAQQALFYALLGTAVLVARRSVVSGSRGLRWMAVLAMASAAAVAIAPRPVDHPREGLLVEAIDVGQGDALLLITPDGKTMLMDAGGFGGAPRPQRDEFDIGEEVVAPALWARGIRKLDVVALSHAHSDHMGGMAAILRDFHPQELWVGNNPPVASYNKLLAVAASLHIVVRPLRQGDELSLGADRVRVLAPLAAYKPGKEPHNNDSLVLQLVNGETSVLLEGDAEAPIEAAMLAEPGLQSTLLKVGHHGSKTSSMPAFIARVRPQVAVISCGLHNRYGHPSPLTLHTLERARVHTIATDLAGASCFVLSGKDVHVDVGCGMRP
jgi:competence protein ComEC